MTTEQRLQRLERKSRWIWWLCLGPVALSVAVGALAHTVTVNKFLTAQETKADELAVEVAENSKELERVFSVVEGLALKVQDLKDDQLVDEGLITQLMGKIEKMESEEMWRKVQALSSINQELSRKIAQLRAEKPSAKDRDGKVRAELCTRPSGRSGLRLTDKNGTVRGFFGTEADGSPFLTLYDAKGNAIWQAPR